MYNVKQTYRISVLPCCLPFKRYFSNWIRHSTSIPAKFFQCNVFGNSWTSKAVTMSWVYAMTVFLAFPAVVFYRTTLRYIHTTELAQSGPTRVLLHVHVWHLTVSTRNTLRISTAAVVSTMMMLMISRFFIDCPVCFKDDGDYDVNLEDNGVL